MTQDTAFTYQPQPPLIPEIHPDQQWFAGMGHRQVQSPDGKGHVSAYAFAGDDTVRVNLSTGSKYVGAHLSVNLHPRELRELARACLDAAAHLEHAGAPSPSPIS